MPRIVMSLRGIDPPPLLGGRTAPVRNIPQERGGMGRIEVATGAGMVAQDRSPWLSAGAHTALGCAQSVPDSTPLGDLVSQGPDTGWPFRCGTTEPVRDSDVIAHEDPARSSRTWTGHFRAVDALEVASATGPPTGLSTVRHEHSSDADPGDDSPT